MSLQLTAWKYELVIHQILINWKHRYNLSYFFLYPVIPSFIPSLKSMHSLWIESPELAHSQTPGDSRQATPLYLQGWKRQMQSWWISNWRLPSTSLISINTSNNLLSLLARWDPVESYILMLSGSTGDGSSIAFQNPLGKKRVGWSKTTQSKLTGFCSHVSTTS